MTSIGGKAFSFCTSLTDVYCYAEYVPDTNNDTFNYSNTENSILHVPASLIEQYNSTVPWNSFGMIVPIEDDSPNITFVNATVKDICVTNWDTNRDGELNVDEAAAVTDLGGVFKGNKQISSFDELQYFTGLTSIGDEAFRYCSGLISVTIPNSVTSIGRAAFYGCSSLSSVTIPEGVTNIGNNSFENCSNMETLKLPDELQIIKEAAFKGCSSLRSITIPASVKFIYEEAFAYCDGLESVKAMPEIPPTLYDNSFSNYNIPLYAPKSAVETYKGTSPWSKFAQFLTLDGTEVEVKQCATPTITFVDGKLKFSCSTEDVEYVYDIKDTDIKKGYDCEVSLSATYEISVYAAKAGWTNSNMATATLIWGTATFTETTPETTSVRTVKCEVPALVTCEPSLCKARPTACL